MSKLILHLLPLFLLAACQTSPKRYQTIMEGEWQAKVLVKDKVKSQSHIVNLDIKAIQNQSLRMDITTPAGLHVASLVLNGEEVEYVLMQDKKFIKGKSSSNALKPIIQVPMNPQILQNIVFDLPINLPGWKCQSDKKHYLVSCDNAQASLRIEWSDRKETSKLVKVIHSKAELQMKFLSFQSHISKREKAFELKVPPKFKVYRLK